MAEWPDTPFKESMLESGVIIHCPNEDLVGELFEILRDHGVQWYGGESMNDTYWDDSDVCYRIMKRGIMRRGDVYCYSDYEYRDYIKCTFYGVEPDFEISDAGFEAIISVGGVNPGGRLEHPVC